MATYLTKQRLEVTAYLIGVELFDRSWKGKSSQELVEFLKQREPHVQSAKYEKEALRVIVDGYVQFLQAGGNIDFTPISSVFLQKLLQQGPVLAIVNYNFLNDVSKYIHNKQLNKPQQDSISGVSSSHMVVIAGYDVGKFLLLDPDFEFGGERWIDEDIVVGAIYLAEADFDGMVLTVQKK